MTKPFQKLHPKVLNQERNKTEKNICPARHMCKNEKRVRFPLKCGETGVLHRHPEKKQIIANKLSKSKSILALTLALFFIIRGVIVMKGVQNKKLSMMLLERTRQNDEVKE